MDLIVIFCALCLACAWWVNRKEEERLENIFEKWEREQREKRWKKKRGDKSEEENQ